jgi:hypothetical protein
MITCPESEPPYPYFAAFVFQLLKHISNLDFEAAGKMIDHPSQDVLQDKLNSANEEGGVFPPVESEHFTIYFYSRGMHRGFDYTVEFYIPCSNTTFETKLEMQRVSGGYEVHLVNC